MHTCQGQLARHLGLSMPKEKHARDAPLPHCFAAADSAAIHLSRSAEVPVSKTHILPWVARKLTWRVCGSASGQSTQHTAADPRENDACGGQHARAGFVMLTSNGQKPGLLAVPSASTTAPFTSKEPCALVAASSL